MQRSKTFARFAGQLTCALLLFASLPATAAVSIHVRSFAHYPQFSLSLAGERIDVRFEDENNLRELEHYSLTFGVAESVNDQLTLRLFGGNSGANIDDRSSTDGLDFNGQFLGLGARWRWDFTERWHLLGDLSIARHELDERRDETRISLHWNRGDARLGASVALGPNSELSAGAAALYVDGKEKLSGDSSGSTDFENEDNASLWARLALRADRRGVVALEWNGGAQNSLQIFFQRKF